MKHKDDAKFKLKIESSRQLSQHKSDLGGSILPKRNFILSLPNSDAVSKERIRSPKKSQTGFRLDYQPEQVRSAKEQSKEVLRTRSSQNLLKNSQ